LVKVLLPERFYPFSTFARFIPGADIERDAKKVHIKMLFGHINLPEMFLGRK
jgi:hypothetical protein